MRLDKWLQVARVFKTRTQATRACNLGRVRVNGQVVKPHRNLALEDEVEIEIRDWTRVLVVKELRDRPLPIGSWAAAEPGAGIRRWRAVRFHWVEKRRPKFAR